MTEEIKEILEALKSHNEVKEYPLILSLEQQKILLDYITNLQQLYENGLKVNQNSHKYITELEMNNAILKEDLDKANDIIEKDRQFNAGRLLEIANLKKENEKLKEQNNDLRKIYRNTYKRLFKNGNDELARYFQAQIDDCPTFYVEPIIDFHKEWKDYKSRCEKANKWVDKHTEIYTKNGISIIDWDNLSDPRKLKNILNGSDKNETNS